MKGLKSLFAVVGTIASLNTTQAASYVWDNQEGLKEVSDCRIVDMDENPFKISKYTGRGDRAYETLRNSSKVQQSNLPIGSLIRFEDGGRKVRGYSKVYVVGVNYSALSWNRYVSKRNDVNYLFSKSILPVDDFAIELTKEVSPAGDKSMKGYTFVPVTTPSYQKLDCEGQSFMDGRDYVVFNGYKDGQETIAVGVSIAETGIFRNIKTIKHETLSNIDTALAVNLSSGEVTQEPTLEEEVVQEETEIVPEQVVEEAAEEKLTDEAVKEETSSEEVVEGTAEKEGPISHLGIDNVICHTRPLSVRGLNDAGNIGDKVLFSAARHEAVKLYQGWEGEAKEKRIGSSMVTYIKVQFVDRESQDQSSGWVSARYVVEASQCPELENHPRDNPASKISGLNDEKCCDFPTVKKPTHAYSGSNGGMRRFSAGRSKGRKHAACDLYRYRGEEARAVAGGEVINIDSFYQGTWEITVKHQGGFVVRYGETIRNKWPKVRGSNGKMRNIRRGDKIDMGDTVAYIGKVNSGCCRPMLHFELYRGNLSGSLTKTYRSGCRGKFCRRDDLKDPTPYLLKWENEVF